MSLAQQRFLDFLEFRAHAVASGFPLEEELPRRDFPQISRVGDDLPRNALAARRASFNSMCRGQWRNRRMPAFPGCASSANT
jgi:hypothetical protein